MGFGYHAHQQPLGVRVPRPPPEWPRRKSRPLRRPPSGLSVCAHVRKSARASSAHGGPDGPEMGTLPTDFPTQAPDRSHRHSHRNDGGRADRRMSHRASRSALTCASPHARSTQHARTRGGRGGTGGPPASFPLRILARWACDVGLSDERARAASSGGAPRHRESHIARAHVSAQVRTSLLLLRMWVAALPGLGNFTGGGAWSPRCTRGDEHARALRGSAARCT